jgi:predicted nucleic acid-binding protein
VVSWWCTAIEVRSAIARLHRNHRITDQEKQGALARLQLLNSGWTEVLPEEQVRYLAATALDKYSLSAADALQLAAALNWCDQHPSKRFFITSDQRLAEAARATGFSVITFP